MKRKEVIEAQLEIILGYYNRIGMNEDCTREEILQWLEGDKEYMQGEIAIYTAEQIVNPPLKNG